MKSVKIGDIKIKNPIVLSPMAGISSLPFRIICNEMGAGYSPTELVSARSIRYNGVDKSLRYMRISPEEEGITAIQLFGSEPEIMAHAANVLQEKHPSLAAIDINMGCPVPKVAVRAQAGSALLKNPEKYHIQKKSNDGHILFTSQYFVEQADEVEKIIKYHIEKNKIGACTPNE